MGCTLGTAAVDVAPNDDLFGKEETNRQGTRFIINEKSPRIRLDMGPDNELLPKFVVNGDENNLTIRYCYLSQVACICPPFYSTLSIQAKAHPSLCRPLLPSTLTLCSLFLSKAGILPKCSREIESRQLLHL